MRSNDPPGIPPGQRAEWFHERYELAARQIVEFLAADFISLTGKDVADIGCGDGIIDLGVAARSKPASLVGFDIRQTDTELLRRLAVENGVGSELPPGLEFRTCTPQGLTSPDASFDVAFSWSAFQHLQHPLSMIRDIRRVLRTGGVLMVQIYPLFHSQHGSLLEPWFPNGFAQFVHEPKEMTDTVLADPGPDPAWALGVLEESRRLNRITIDELGEMLRAAGFRVRRLHLFGEDSTIPPEASHLPLSQLGIAGGKLLAEAVGW